MSATMARQGGRVQLEQSDMHLALNMAKMAKEGFVCLFVIILHSAASGHGISRTYFLPASSVT